MKCYLKRLEQRLGKFEKCIIKITIFENSSKCSTVQETSQMATVQFRLRSKANKNVL
jgi:hypothetical protein